VARKQVHPPEGWSRADFEEAVRLRARAAAERRREQQRWSGPAERGETRVVGPDGRPISRRRLAERAGREAVVLRSEIDRLVAVAGERFGEAFAEQLRTIARAEDAPG
jgi:hypothetical protein